MAFTFTDKATATLKMKSASGNEMLSIGGVNATITSADTAAEQANKIFAIGGLSVTADANAKLITTKEAVEDE